MKKLSTLTAGIVAAAVSAAAIAPAVLAKPGDITITTNLDDEPAITAEIVDIKINGQINTDATPNAKNNDIVTITAKSDDYNIDSITVNRLDKKCNEDKDKPENAGEVCEIAVADDGTFTMPQHEVAVTIKAYTNIPAPSPIEPTEDEPTEEEPTEETEEEDELFVAPDTGVSSAAILFGAAATLTLGGVLVSLKAKQA